MTITIPEYWLWIAILMMAISIVLNILLIKSYKAKAKAEAAMTEAVMRWVSLNAKLADRVDEAVKAMNAETGSQWMRIKGVQHVDIKSKLIANSFANGKETMQFKNGVIVVAEERGTRTLMEL